MSEAFEILLVEDDPNDVRLTTHALRKENLANRIRVARDGQEALDVLFAEGPATPIVPRLILLDLKLPKVSGLDVLRRIKADERTRHVPVVVMTSSNQESDLVRSYDLGVNSYVVKPVAFDSFNDVVRQLGIYWLLVNRAPD